MHAPSTPFRNATHLLRRHAAGWWLLALLVVAPWLGTLHAVVHPAAPPGVWAQQHLLAAHGVDGPVDGTATTVAQAQKPEGLQRLFGSHDAGECRVYDQLLHADALLTAPPLVGSAVWTPIRLPAPPQPSPSCGSAVFEARAPPSTR